MQNLSAFCENVLGYRREILTGQYVEAGSAAVQSFTWVETAAWSVDTEVANNKHLHCMPLAKLHDSSMGSVWECCEK